MNTSKLIVGHKYKIAENTKFNKVRLRAISDSTITVAARKTEKQMPLSSIKGIKTRKFSVIKTAAIVTVVVLVVPIVNYLLDPQINVDFGNINLN